MTKSEMEEKIKALEKELAILEILVEGNLLTNDRINEAFFIIRELEKTIKNAQ